MTNAIERKGMNQEIDNLLIHIGYHKTGTTWLQDILFTTENNIFEPMSKTSKGHSSLANHFIYDDEHYCLSPFDINEERIKKEIEIIKKIKQKKEQKYFVISHERLSGNPHSGGFDAKKIAYMLKRTFPNAKIFIVIREQMSFILSNYFQYLSIGGTYSLNKYLNTKYDGKRPFFSPSHIKYFPLINEYYNLFGKNNVLVLPYEMFRHEPLLFIEKIGNFVKNKIDINEDLINKKLNTKSHEFTMYYMRFLNYFKKSSSINNYPSLSNKYTRKLANALFTTACTLFPTRLDIALKNRLKKQIINYVADRYVESNKELSKLLEVDLSPYGYY